VTVGGPPVVRPVELRTAASMEGGQVLALLGTTSAGLTTEEVQRRLSRLGPNAVRSHRAGAVRVLLRQLRSPLLVLLAVTASASFFVGEHTDALIIGLILAASVGLGFVNEYRAERAAQALHDKIRHQAVVVRNGHPRSIDVVDLVPGDIVDVQLGEVVPADIRLLSANALECDRVGPDR